MTKRGLGRGLGALLGEGSTADVTTPPAAQARRASADPARADPPEPASAAHDISTPHALDELRASIAAFGVLVPIIVRERADGYELIAGERRWRAAQAAGLETIPAIVRPADDRESLEVAIIENLQRENLDALEEAMGFAHLMETYDFTQEQVARTRRQEPPGDCERIAAALAARFGQTARARRQADRGARARDPRAAAGAARGDGAPRGRRRAVGARARTSRARARRQTRARAAGAARARAATTNRSSSGLRYQYATHVRVVAQRTRRNDRAALRRCGRLDAHRRPAAGRTAVKRVRSRRVRAAAPSSRLGARARAAAVPAGAAEQPQTARAALRRRAARRAITTRVRAADRRRAHVFRRRRGVSQRLRRRRLSRSKSARSPARAATSAAACTSCASASRSSTTRRHAARARRDGPARRAARARRAAHQGSRQTVPRVRVASSSPTCRGCA